MRTRKNKPIRLNPNDDDDEFTDLQWILRDAKALRHAWRTVVDLSTNAQGTPKEEMRFKASMAVLNRIVGMPKQSHEVTGKLEMTRDQAIHAVIGFMKDKALVE